LIWSCTVLPVVLSPLCDFARRNIVNVDRRHPKSPLHHIIQPCRRLQERCGTCGG